MHPVTRPNAGASRNAAHGLVAKTVEQIRALHFGLLEALKREADGSTTSTRTPILTCLSTLISRTPYQAIPSEPSLVVPIRGLPVSKLFAQRESNEGV